MENNEAVINVAGLSKRYGKLTAVDSLSFTVYRGDVFGFLGPNGAGKSTTIRMLTTLIHPTAGEISIFGQSLRKNRLKILGRIGAIVEKPDFYKYLTAYKNLEILARIAGCDSSKAHIMKTLDLVGLASRADSKVKTYSHGMKQRLGIAQALLHNPELIILDEPSTGLDPQGMKDIRDLVQFLSREQNKTIFLSSHILYEIETIANRMIIIDKGRKIIEGNVHDLINSSELTVLFEISDIAKALVLIESSPWRSKIKEHTEFSVSLAVPREEIPGVNEMMVSNGIKVFSVVPSRSLEKYFLNLTTGENNV